MSSPSVGKPRDPRKNASRHERRAPTRFPPSYIAPPPVDRSTVVDYELSRRARAATTVLLRGHAKIVPAAIPTDDVWAYRWIERALNQIADKVLPTPPVLSEADFRDWATERDHPIRTKADRAEAKRFLAWEYATMAGHLEAHLAWMQPW